VNLDNSILFIMSTTQTETQTENVSRFSKPKDLVDFSGMKFDDWRDEFHKNGCVVLKNVITPERAAYYQEKQLKWLHNFELGFDENDESTWNADHLPVSFKGGSVLFPSSEKQTYVLIGLTKIECTMAMVQLTKRWPGKQDLSPRWLRFSRSYGAPRSFSALLMA